jgi:hypothetical protein
VNLPVTNVPRCISRNAKTRGLYHLQLPDVAEGSGLPDWTCVIHHATNEVPVEQHTVSDGQAASPVKEGAKHTQSLSCLLSHLADVRLPGKQCMKGHPKIPRCFDPLYWLSETLHCSGFLDASRGLNKEYGCAF